MTLRWGEQSRPAGLWFVKEFVAHATAEYELLFMVEGALRAARLAVRRRAQRGVL